MSKPHRPKPPTFELEVRTPEALVYQGEVVSLRVPGSGGDFGVLAHHAPMLAALRCGILHIRHADNSVEQMASGGGFAHVGPRQVKLVLDYLNAPQEVDRDRAHGALERALERLAKEREDIDIARAEAALCRAVSRLRVCGCGCRLCEQVTRVV